MKILKNSVVTIDYSAADIEGTVVDEGAQPITYLHGGYEMGLFPKIEAALDGQTVGFSIDVELSPEEAFGEYDEDLVEEEVASNLPSDIEIGMQFERGGEDGESEPFVYTVTEIDGNKITLDANHLLSGIPLVFSCTVTAVREATTAEVKAGMAL